MSLLLGSCENETLNLGTSDEATIQGNLGEGWTKINYRGNLIDVKEIDGHYLWGDILIPLTTVNEVANSDGTFSQKASITADSKWPTNTIRFYFDANFGNERTARIAMHHWELFTTVDFVEVDNPADDDLIVFKGSGCNATVGYRDGRHENSVSIGSDCDVSEAIHEFGHVVGFYHEHNRNDRDEYVEVFFENIFESAHTQFIKNEDKGLEALEFTPFDFESVMIYASDNSSIEGRNNSILKLDGSSYDRSDVLSKYDVEGFESIYRDGSPKKIAISSLINGGKYISSENGRQAITSNRTKPRPS